MFVVKTLHIDSHTLRNVIQSGREVTLHPDNTHLRLN